MASLPSFVELMSSLGLDDETSYPASSPASGRPRSLSSASSSSAQDDDCSPYTRTGQYLLVPIRHGPQEHGGDPDASIPRVSRQSKGRYSPYSAAAIPRRGSLPVTFADAEANGRPKRAISSSPSHLITPPSHRAIWVSRPSRSERSSRQSWSKESDRDSITPISTYVRRKSPGGSPAVSPTSPSFPRSIDIPLAPVAIPALPTLLPSFVLLSPPTDAGSDGMPLSHRSRSNSRALFSPSNVHN